MSAHCSRIFLLLIERSVCRLQSDDSADPLCMSSMIAECIDGGANYQDRSSCMLVFDLFDLVSVYVQNTISRGSVDIRLVHHVAVRVFSCTLVEECYLYCKVMTSILTCMSLTLARLCGKCCMIHFRHFVSKVVRYLCPEIQLIQGMKSIFVWEKYLWEKVSLPRSFVGKISCIYILE